MMTKLSANHALRSADSKKIIICGAYTGPWVHVYGTNLRTKFNKHFCPELLAATTKRKAAVYRVGRDHQEQRQNKLPSG